MKIFLYFFLVFLICVSFVSGFLNDRNFYWVYSYDDDSLFGNDYEDLDTAVERNGTVDGATTGVGSTLGEAISCDGSNDRILVLNGSAFFALASPFTYCTFLENVTANNGLSGEISGTSSGTSTGGRNIIGGTNDRFNMYYYDGAWRVATSTSAATGNQRTHVCFVWTPGTNMTVYVNASVEATTSISSSTATKSWYNCESNPDSGDGQQFFNGVQDESFLSSETISPDEVIEHYNSGVGLSYPFAEVVITQSSYNVTNSVLNGTVWRTNQSFPVITLDNTPTVIFDVSISSNCSIGTVDTNFTNMTDENSERKCGTTDVVSHTCTLPVSDVIPFDESDIFISCVGSNGIENSSSSSSNLRINLTNHAPVVVVSGVNFTHAVNNGTFIQEVSASDADGDTLVYSLDDDDGLGKLEINNLTGNITSNSNWFVTDIGRYNVTVNVSDGFSITRGVFELGINSSSAVNVTLLFDGLNISRKYEIGYVGNISVVVDAMDRVWLDIVHPDYGINFTTDSANVTNSFEFLFNITNLSVIDFNGSSSVVIKSNGSVISIILRNNSELASLEFNITGVKNVTYPENVSVGTSSALSVERYVGIFKGKNQYQKQYYQDDVLKDNGEIVFVRPGVQTINFEINQPKENGTIIFNITGNESNSGSDFDLLEGFNPLSSGIDSHELVKVSGDSVVYYDRFNESNVTSFLWSESTVEVCDGTGCSNSVAFSKSGNTNYVITSSIISATDQGQSQGFINTTGSGFDLKNYWTVQFNFSMDADCIPETGCPNNIPYIYRLSITDGTTSVIVAKFHDANGTVSNAEKHISEQEFVGNFRLDENNNYARFESTFSNEPFGNTSLSSLDNSKTWRFFFLCHTGPNGLSRTQRNVCRVLDGFKFDGLTINDTTLVSGFSKGNYTSDVVKNTTSTITSAILSWVEKARFEHIEFVNPANLNNLSWSSVTGLLSNDGGSNWVVVQNGVSKVFDTSGTQLMFRFNYSTSNNTFVPEVSRVRVQIVPEFLDNFTIDVGADSSFELSISRLNHTNVTLINTNDVLVACDKGFQGRCNITVDFASDTTGKFVLNSFNYTHDLNPLIFLDNETLLRTMENVTNPKLIINFSGGNLTVDDLDLRYWGSGNITIRAHTTVSQANHTLIMRISRFILSKLKPFFVLTPRSWDSKNVEPFGQSAKRASSFYNVSIDDRNDDNMNLSFQLNETLDTCVQLFVSNESSRSPTYILPNNGSEVWHPPYLNMSIRQNEQIFVWSNFTSCNASITLFYDPWNYFNSICVDCVRNLLNNGTVTDGN